MRVLFGIVLVCVGFAMAVAWMPSHENEMGLAVVTGTQHGIARVARPDEAAFDETRRQAPRTFSPQTPLLTPSAKPSATIASAVAPSPVLARPAASGEIFATVTAPSVAVAAYQGPARATGRALDDASRIELVRSLQRELKRVGCYAGDIDGDWGSGSKRAMSAFIDRVNASLPHDDPDYILLTMVQGNTTQVCGKGCPVGQTLTEGKCTPNAVMAHSGRKGDATRYEQARAEPQVQASAPAPVPAPRRADRQPDAQTRTDTRTAALEVQPAPRGETRADVRADNGWTTSVQGPMTTAAVVGAAGAVAAALPGRMSIGGPLPSPDAAPHTPTPAGRAVQAAAPHDDADDARHARGQQSAPMRGSQQQRVIVYRDAPRYRPPAYAAPAPRVRYSRNWTAGFFDRQP